ncbi:MAG: Plug domain-containing protein, partial [Desulfobacteraceae bacterium]
MKVFMSPLLALFMIALVSISYLDNQICYAANEVEPEKSKLDFTKFSLEELKNVKIVSVSRKPEKVSEVPAAVYVITQEDIRRSGATSIPEVLRLAPGVHVARITATDWAINIRGMNNEFAKNLLVLIDGRSVYTHLFSGVFWDIQ